MKESIANIAELVGLFGVTVAICAFMVEKVATDKALWAAIISPFALLLIAACVTEMLQWLGVIDPV